MPQVQMTEFEPIPTGVYPAILTEIKAGTNKFGPVFNWVFKVTQAIGTVKAGQVVTGMTSQALTTKSKMYQWIQAFGVANVAVNQNFNTDVLLNKNVAIEVTQKGDYSNVTMVRSMEALAALANAVAPPVQPGAVPQQPVNAVGQPPVQTPQQPVNVMGQPVQPVSNPTTPVQSNTPNLEIGDSEALF
jgi:hypothetical protein